MPMHPRAIAETTGPVSPNLRNLMSRANRFVQQLCGPASRLRHVQFRPVGRGAGRTGASANYAARSVYYPRPGQPLPPTKTKRTAKCRSTVTKIPHILNMLMAEGVRFELTVELP